MLSIQTHYSHRKYQDWQTFVFVCIGKLVGTVIFARLRFDIESSISITVVFMGSEKYPDENEFDSFTKKHGGGSNAYTDCERVSFSYCYAVKLAFKLPFIMPSIVSM